MTPRNPGDSLVSHSNEDLRGRVAVFVFERLTCSPSVVSEVAADFEASLDRRRDVSPNLVPVGAWQSLYSDESQITHLYAFDDLAHLESVTKQLSRDTATKAQSSSARRSAWLMSRLPYSPVELATHIGNALAQSDRVYWVIEVQCSKDSVANCIGIHDSGMARRGELDESLLAAGAFKMLYGGSNNSLIHLYAYDSLAEMERLNALLFSDKVFREHVQPKPDDSPSIWEWSTRTSLLKPLPYSQMQ